LEIYRKIDEKEQEEIGIYNQYLIPYRMNSHNLFPTDLNEPIPLLSQQIFQKTSKSDQRIVDIKQTIISVVFGASIELYENQQIQINQDTTDKRPTLSSIPKRLEWKYGSTMAVCKLRGNESVDYTSSSESEPFNQITNYRCTEKRNQANMQELPNLSDLVEN
ncbi:5773_t:CDS:2, partial [Funneliformis geosporum]